MPLRKNRITRKKHARSVKLQPLIKRYMSEKIYGIVRHVLGFIGGIAVAKGWLTAEQLPGILGGILAIIAAIWSVKSKGAEIPKAIKVVPLLLLAAMAAALLPSCKTPTVSGDNLPPVSAYVGTATVAGAEVQFGTHAVGLAATYRNVPDPEAPPSGPSGSAGASGLAEIPIVYPQADK